MYKTLYKFKTSRWKMQGGESVKIVDSLEIKHFREGKLLTSKEVEDLVTNVGKNKIAALISGLDTAYFTHIAIGSGGTVAPDATQTSLASETHRVVAERSTVTTDTEGDTAQFVGAFTFTSSLAINESGVFDAATGGNMLCRQTFPTYNVVPDDVLQLTWKIKVA